MVLNGLTQKQEQMNCKNRLLDFSHKILWKRSGQCTSIAGSVDCEEHLYPEPCHLGPPAVLLHHATHPARPHKQVLGPHREHGRLGNIGKGKKTGAKSLDISLGERSKKTTKIWTYVQIIGR